jgi:hypothetical protein
MLTQILFLFFIILLLPFGLCLEFWSDCTQCLFNKYERNGRENKILGVPFNQ